ncbi:SDR family oxidoreductase [Limibacter armeniacum]|uniref:SDR family oxidoreductase n=1 Tax=Limibacter armeniacum TaxID=466084 RepID=UPI002FE66595
MKILLTGSTGYIGRRLLPVLVQNGHEVVCLVRDHRRFDIEDFDQEFLNKVKVIEADLLDSFTLNRLPRDIDAAYYLVHSMSSATGDFSDLERKAAENFVSYIDETKCQQIIYLGGICNDNDLSKHLTSRKQVEETLRTSKAALSVLRAAIIIGSGGASFEVIRDLVEKLPVMIAPKWVETRCQPIAIRNVIQYLDGVLLKKEAFNRVFDIGGPDILTYKQMLLAFANVRNLKRRIITVPVFTPRLSSYWLYFVTSTSFRLARNLVDSMHNEVTCLHEGIDDIVPIKKLSYREALELAFQRIEQNEVVSSWIDAIQGPIQKDFMDFIQVPKYGCFTDKRYFEFERNTEEVLDNIWGIGGERGWYYASWLWGLRGLMDRIVGGVGLRRGRRSPSDLKAGEALDFWRVLLADRKNKRLLLFAEMKLPGEAWLEFKIKENPFRKVLMQKATFRPLGIWGRLYWYLVYPMHIFIFPGMAKRLINYRDTPLTVITTNPA